VLGCSWLLTLYINIRHLLSVKHSYLVGKGRFKHRRPTFIAVATASKLPCTNFDPQDHTPPPFFLVSDTRPATPEPCVVHYIPWNCVLISKCCDPEVIRYYHALLRLSQLRATDERLLRSYKLIQLLSIALNQDHSHLVIIPTFHWAPQQVIHPRPWLT
jgi:hypothetical protein